MGKSARRILVKVEENRQATLQQQVEMEKRQVEMEKRIDVLEKPKVNSA